MPFVLADGGSVAFARSTSLDPNLEADQQPVDLIRPARPTVDQDAPHRRGNPLWQIPLKVLGATRERPLFSASRRPPVPPVVAAVYVPPPPPPPAPKLEPDRPLLTLVGTIAGHTDEIGIFVDDATSKILRLKPGQDFGGWVLLAIKGRSAEFKKADRTATLGLPARNETGPQRGLPVTPVSNVALNIGGGPLLATSPPQSYSPVGGQAAGGDPWMGPIDFSGRKNKK
jgi:general secretion pathway protein N